ncbi:MAG TPA: PIN domain-containing protein [Flavobacteriales bacterium]|nr:PIN domain-containing protein [Flavobacteriales bacterium]HMU13634.1 PIN domain-containing protein [Flavobacteriales bacterium]HNA32419.1 PIN domain-containing protein [Flavobacteriales bacterium]HNE80232.1 PIN domain-containing protein [Flavobacteriales bacterium]HNI04481.1 PIN domain-containing protein [Flavobacteriales bacterium]
MEAVLIDTSVLIGRFRRESRAMAAMERIVGAQFCLCDAIIAEVLAGTRNKAEFALTKRELFEQFHLLPLTMEVSQRFRSILDGLELGRDIHFADQLIAATAMAHDVPLLTLNKKHFTPIKGLKLA